jgi:hypothetical protein
MKNFQKLSLLLLLVSSLSLSSCLHIIEDVTFNKNGSGTYKMTIDMSELKGMMEMLKGMNTGEEGDMAMEEGSDMSMDTTMVDQEVEFVPPVAVDEQITDAPPTEDTDMSGGDAGTSDQMSQMGEQLAGGVKNALEGVPGITNVVETQDTVNFQFGYSFDFANVDALNKAIKIINKEKYDTRADKTFAFSGKNFERFGVGNIGEEMKNALTQGGDESGEEGGGDMVKSMFSEMSYTQVYHFPDRKVKKSTNKLSALSDDGHTLTIKMKVFDDVESKNGVATAVKLK